MKVAAINGTITMTDGTVSEFSITTDGGWQQWGTPRQRLGESVDAMEAMVRGLLEDDVLASDNDE